MSSYWSGSFGFNGPSDYTIRYYEIGNDTDGEKEMKPVTSLRSKRKEITYT